MQMLISLLCAAALLVVTVSLHSAGLNLMRYRLLNTAKEKHRKLPVAVLSVIGLHIIEIILYAAVLWFLNYVIDAGDFGGNREFSPIDYFYYSAETFTALGSGDLTVTSGLRLLSAVEALNGLVLIAWSGAFTYWVMEYRWNGQQ